MPGSRKPTAGDGDYFHLHSKHCWCLMKYLCSILYRLRKEGDTNHGSFGTSDIFFFDEAVGVGETKVKGVDFPLSFGIGKPSDFFFLIRAPKL